MGTFCCSFSQLYGRAEFVFFFFSSVGRQEAAINAMNDTCRSGNTCSSQSVVIDKYKTTSELVDHLKEWCIGSRPENVSPMWQNTGQSRTYVAT
jgi:hypothetical protein